MNVPASVSHMIEQELTALHQNPRHTLHRARRNTLYAAFGPAMTQPRRNILADELARIEGDTTLDPYGKAYCRLNLYRASGLEDDPAIHPQMVRDLAYIRSDGDRLLVVHQAIDHFGPYLAFSPPLTLISNRVRVHLGIITARLILPVWQNAPFVQDETPGLAFVVHAKNLFTDSADPVSRHTLEDILSTHPHTTPAEVHQAVTELTPTHITPAWQKATRALLEDTSNAERLHAFRALGDQLDWGATLYCVPNHDVAAYLIQVAEAVLAGDLSVRVAGAVAGEARAMFGTLPDIYEDNYPIWVADAGTAAMEALSLTYTHVPFIDDGLVGHGTPFGDAAGAVADALTNVNADDTTGDEELLFEREIDPVKSRVFWEWWLTAAVPEAWQHVIETVS